MAIHITRYISDIDAEEREENSPTGTCGKLAHFSRTIKKVAIIMMFMICYLDVLRKHISKVGKFTANVLEFAVFSEALLVNKVAAIVQIPHFPREKCFS